MKITDPVCGIEIETKWAQSATTYQGEHYYFCSTKCQRSFKANPAKFAARVGQAGGTGAHGDGRTLA